MYSIKLCLCWKELVIEEHTLAPRFSTEEAAQAYAKGMQAGPRLLHAVLVVRTMLRALITGVLPAEQRAERIVAAYGELGAALDGRTEKPHAQETRA